MANVCQKCGASENANLLIYCRICRDAAEHQYCLDIIPKEDEDIDWSCEDCKFNANELVCVVNNQGLEKSNNDLCLSNKENIISNQNIANDSNTFQVFHNRKNGANWLAHKYYKMKSWGKTSTRSTKHILKELKDQSREEITKLTECTKPKPKPKPKHIPKLKRRRRKLILDDEDDELLNNVARDSLFRSEDHVEKDWEKTHVKSMKHDHLGGEVTTTYFVDCSNLVVSRRKLVLPDDDDDNLTDDSSLANKIISEEMIPQHRSTETSEHLSDARAMPLINEGDDKFETSLLKEAIVSFKDNTSKEFDEKSIDGKIDDEMTSHGESNVEIRRLSKVPTKVHLQNSTKSQSEFNDMLALPISWRGWLKVCGRNCGPLIARLSPKAGEKAWNATGLLPQIIQLSMVSRSHAWPRSFKVAPPTDDNIALAFFPPDSRVEKMAEQLVQEVIRCDLALKVVLSEAELLIFPSNLLPENYKRYQDKYYLWGVFKRKDSDKNISEIRMPEANESNCTSQADHNSPIKSDKVEMERVYKEMSLDKDEPHETLCTLTDVSGGREMGYNNLEADEELNGCLELFPTHVENIALRLSTEDGKKDVDLELGLGLPFRR